MKCPICGSTVFSSEESWSIIKTVTIDLESGYITDGFFDESAADYRDSDPWKCANGHVASYQLSDALYDAYQGYFG